MTGDASAAARKAGPVSGGRPAGESAAAGSTAPAELPPTIEFRTSDPTRVVPADWESRAAKVRAELAADGIAPSDLFQVLVMFRFLDDANRSWSYTGDQWLTWDGRQWLPAPAPGPLRMVLSMDLGPQPGPEPVPPQDKSSGPVYEPTHLIPPTGAPAWANPDASVPPVATLPPNLDVMVTDWAPTGWARVAASNGWRGWIDGRQLRPNSAPALRR